MTTQAALSPSTAAARLRLALEMADAGVAMMRMNLRRRHPSETDAQIDARLQAWLERRAFSAVEGCVASPPSEGGDSFLARGVSKGNEAEPLRLRP